MLNFQWRKTFRNGASPPAGCPVQLENRRQVLSKNSRGVYTSRPTRLMEYDKKGPLFATVPLRRAAGGPPMRGSQPWSANQMSPILKRHAKNADEHTRFLIQYFRPGGAVSRALVGRLDGDYHAGSVLENPANSLHASNGGSLARRGGICHGGRCFREPVQWGVQRIPSERAE